MNKLFDGLHWFFTDPETGKLVIAEKPNPPLIGFMAAKAVQIVAPGAISTIAAWISAALLAYWAIDEIVRGSSPWRRTLGATVLAWQALNLPR